MKECSWSPGFHLDGPDDDVYDSIVFDDGTGPALYVAGAFTTIGTEIVNHVARWDGTSWSALDSGADGFVYALEVFDDGSGPALYAAGLFQMIGGRSASRIAKWDGAEWSALGPGGDEHPPNWSAVLDLATYEHLGDPVLVAVGLFDSLGGIAANSIATWNGLAWATLGEGLDSGTIVNGEPRPALVNSAVSAGSVLYVSGDFVRAGTVEAQDVAAWDGSTWSSLGLDGALTEKMVIFDSGHGPQLHRVGASKNGIIRWDGSQWHAVGETVDVEVSGLFVHDDGTGPTLLASALDRQVGTYQTRIVPITLQWKGTSWVEWQPLPELLPFTIATFDAGNGPVTHVGGRILDGASTTSLARREGEEWSSVTSVDHEPGSGFDDGVYDFAVFDDGTGPALYAAGDFRVAGGRPVHGVARWTDGSWQAVGGGLMVSGRTYGVRSLEVYDDGDGPRLYAGGKFTLGPGDEPTRQVAQWDGISWSPVGASFEGGSVNVLAIFDDGGGPGLVAGGDFSSIAGTEPAGNVAIWDGAAWSPMGDGTSARVRDLAVYDDGNGPRLYAAGSFSSPDHSSRVGVAQWDGASWVYLSDGITTSGNVLQSFDEGAGSKLYVAGWSDQLTLSTWDGTSWSSLPPPPETVSVSVLEVLDRGDGPALYAGGSDSLYTARVALLHGESWTLIETSPPGHQSGALALATWPFPSGRALVLGGTFEIVGGVPALHVATATQCRSALLFTDDFESGTTENWTHVVH